MLIIKHVLVIASLAKLTTSIKKKKSYLNLRNLPWMCVIIRALFHVDR